MNGPKSVRQQGWGEITLPADFPEIVCLCGSTKFASEFNEINKRLTLEGKIVLSIGCHVNSDKELKITIEKKIKLDALHFLKIDMADSIFVVNVKGYVGESTALEIAHATQQHRPIKYLEEGLDEDSTLRVHKAIYGELKP